MRDEPVFPLGLGYLASSLKKHGHDVKGVHFVRDLHAEKMLPQFIRKFDPDVIGFNCTSFTRGAVRKFISIARAISPSALIVAGGVHASFLYFHMLNYYGVDAVVIGEGERTFPELCNAIESGGDFSKIDGLAYKEDGVMVVTKRREFIENLDELPPPDYSFARGIIQGSGIGFSITSRGCPAKCKFCCTSAYWGQKVRMHSPKRVVDDLEMITTEFGVKKIFLHDDTFNLGVSRVLEICKGIIDRGLKVEWGASCRVNPVSPEMIEAMVGAGCRHICWGIETGSPKIAEWMNKKITFEQVRQAYALCEPYSHKGLLSTGAFMMVGLPGETDETVRESMDFLDTISLTDDPSCSITYVLPGTKLWEEQKVINEDFWVRSDEMIYSDSIGGPHMGYLQRWGAKISMSGKKIPFDLKKHFWYGIIRGEIPIPECPTELT
jgi:radical SAM superfamily enzyme YgiQ (UPF0313 family)